MSTIFLHPKRGSFYHRSHVPRRLRSLLNGRAEVWRSLDTADKDEARAVRPVGCPYSTTLSDPKDERRRDDQGRARTASRPVA